MFLYFWVSWSQRFKGLLVSYTLEIITETGGRKSQILSLKLKIKPVIGVNLLLLQLEIIASGCRCDYYVDAWLLYTFIIPTNLGTEGHLVRKERFIHRYPNLSRRSWGDWTWKWKNINCWIILHLQALKIFKYKSNNSDFRLNRPPALNEVLFVGFKSPYPLLHSDILIQVIQNVITVVAGT